MHHTHTHNNILRFNTSLLVCAAPKPISCILLLPYNFQVDGEGRGCTGFSHAPLGVTRLYPTQNNLQEMKMCQSRLQNNEIGSFTVLRLLGEPKSAQLFCQLTGFKDFVPEIQAFASYTQYRQHPFRDI